MRRIGSLFLAVFILLSLAATGLLAVSADEAGLILSDEGIRILKAEEGFSRVPYWDYAQWTVGYGTRCPDDKLEEYTTYGISEEDAEALLRDFLARYENALNAFAAKRGLTLSQQQFDALMLFSYNCGTGWTSETKGTFYNAVVGGATGNDFIRAITLWCSAGGQIKTFLLRRRLSEANMYLNGQYSQTPPENYSYVLLDPNGGSMDYLVQGYDAELTDSIVRTPKYEGYTFDGWYTERTGGRKVTVLDASVRSQRLYAHWVDAEGKDPSKPDRPVRITVTGSDVNLRQGPGTNYGIVGTANKGDQMQITETAYGNGYTWGKFDGGWIALEFTNYKTAVNEQPEEAPPEETEPEVTEPEETEPEVTEPEKPGAIMGTVKVNDLLCIRSGPGTGYSVVDYLGPNARVEILEQKTVGTMVWGQIDKGWISMKYVELDPVQVPDETPEITPPETTTPETTVPEETEPEVTEPETTPPTVPEEPTPVTQWTGKVTSTTELRIRSGPSTNYSIVGYLNPGTRVTITEKQDSGSMTWGKMEKGWISLDYVKLDTPAAEETAPASVTGTVKVSDWLRVRTGPGTGYTIAAYLTNGTKVTVLETRNVGSTTWGRIEQGWVSLDYVKLDSQPAQPQKVIKTVTADCLCVRSNAGTSNSIVGYLYEGAKVEILETKNVGSTAWGRTSKGWISLDYAK